MNEIDNLQVYYRTDAREVKLFQGDITSFDSPEPFDLFIVK